MLFFIPDWKQILNIKGIPWSSAGESIDGIVQFLIGMADSEDI